MTAASESGRPIRVFLLDDHEVVRAAVCASCSRTNQTSRSSARRSPRRRRYAGSPPCASMWPSSTPGLGDGSGIDVCREIRSRDESIRTIILTSYDDDDALFAANMAGAAGYVLKQIHGTDLVDGIRRVAADQSLLDPAVIARVLQRLRDGVGPPDELAALTGRSGRS